MDQTWWRNADQLDDDQKEIVALPIDQSNLVTGPPGSGKTNLLLLRAAFLTRAGHQNIAIITFNRLLKEFIASGSANYPFEESRVSTMIGWGNELLKSAGESVIYSNNFREARRIINEKLKTLISTDPSGMKFDCILVDEAQDYSVEEIEHFRYFGRTLYAVGDNNQRIYGQSGAITHLEGFCVAPPALKFHYRNGQAICKMADAIQSSGVGSMLESCNYDEQSYPSSVTRFGNLTIEQQVTASVIQIEAQILAYPGEWIGILAPKNIHIDEIYARMVATSLADKIQIQSQHAGYDALDQEKPVVLSTMHSAKGLEYRAVHLFAVDRIKDLSSSRNLAYTAVTRAKTSLSIYHHSALPGYIEAGLHAVNGAPTTTPALADLFGKP